MSGGIGKKGNDMGKGGGILRKVKRLKRERGSERNGEHCKKKRMYESRQS